MSDPKPRMNLCIAMPIVDSVPGEAFPHHIGTFLDGRMIAVERDCGFMTLIPLDLNPHDNARQTIVEKAIEKEVTHLFFMDDDTITPRGGLTKLLLTMEEQGAKVVSGLYLRRGFPYTSVWSVDKSESGKDEEFYSVEADSGIHEIHCSGLGCALLDLKWMMKNVPQPWFKMLQDEKRTLITDDVVMFKKVREAGGLIIGDADVQCTHVGRREFITRNAAKDLRSVFHCHEEMGKVSGKVVNTNGSPSETRFVSKEEALALEGSR